MFIEHFYFQNRTLRGDKLANGKVNYVFLKGNSLAIKDAIPDDMKFDLIMADPPMGVLDTKSDGASWDTHCIDFKIMFKTMYELLNEDGVLICFSHITLVSTWIADIKTHVKDPFVYVLYHDKSENYIKMGGTGYCKFKFIHFSR